MCQFLYRSFYSTLKYFLTLFDILICFFAYFDHTNHNYNVGILPKSLLYDYTNYGLLQLFSSKPMTVQTGAPLTSSSGKSPRDTIPKDGNLV